MYIYIAGWHSINCTCTAFIYVCTQLVSCSMCMLLYTYNCIHIICIIYVQSHTYNMHNIRTKSCRSITLFTAFYNTFMQCISMQDQHYINRHRLIKPYQPYVQATTIGPSDTNCKILQINMHYNLHFVLATVTVSVSEVKSIISG